MAYIREHDPRSGAGSTTSTDSMNSSLSKNTMKSKEKIPGFLFWLAGGNPKKKPTKEDYDLLYRQTRRRDDPDRPKRTIDPQMKLPKSLWYIVGGRGDPPTVQEWNNNYRQTPLRGRNGDPGRAGEILGVGDWGLSEEQKQQRREEDIRKRLARFI